jgi:hypothetical protein
MNIAEERLRSAARAARETFPPGGAMPQLSLPDPAVGRSRGGQRRSPGVAGRPARAWLAPAAAAAAVAVLVSGIVALHQSAPGAHTGHRPRAGSSSQTAAAQQQEQRLRRDMDALVVAAFVPATGPQYDQGTKLIWLVRNREIRDVASCMAASGYHVSGASQPFVLGDLADNTEWPDLPRIARTHELVPAGGLTLPSYSKTEQRALRVCYSRAFAIYRGLIDGGEALGWLRIVSRIQASARVRAAVPALNACATRYGFPDNPYGNAFAPIKSFGDFMNWVAGFLDGASSRGASAATMRALERHWSMVFVACARPIVGIWQNLQQVAQRRFLPRNAAELRQLDQLAWRLLGPQASQPYPRHRQGRPAG